jgi:hypothetical protein
MVGRHFLKVFPDWKANLEYLLSFVRSLFRGLEALKILSKSCKKNIRFFKQVSKHSLRGLFQLERDMLHSVSLEKIFVVKIVTFVNNNYH